ncbi:hypothetical protein [Actinomyces ruminis]|uniref:Uncharacterized protein n=1 Tax=Actinomyces ruminis TaxID=1937003 RepID=A0ABX4M8M1_9ACTO|nr:hypothetical protein [Actinomyces ruminis]PHP51803.1 hypothetical protein BW737_014070 [Actinomyces ruminis]
MANEAVKPLGVRLSYNGPGLYHLGYELAYDNIAVDAQGDFAPEWAGLLAQARQRIMDAFTAEVVADLFDEAAEYRRRQDSWDRAAPEERTGYRMNLAPGEPR